MSLSRYLENKILNAVLRRTPFDVKDVFVSLHTRDSAKDGGGEVEGNQYARQAAMFLDATEGMTGMGGVLDFDEMPDVTVTHVGLWDAEQGGNFLWGGALVEAREVQHGDMFRMPQGNIVVSII